MRVLAGRRPELMLLASLLFFATILIVRSLQDQSRSLVAVDMAAPAPVPAELGSEAMIARLQERIRQAPNDTAAYAQLGLAFLQRVRETADPTLYPKAEAALAEAIKRDPQQPDAVAGQGMLALARHQFTDAQRWGERAHAINPFAAGSYGIIGDAQVELGRYGEAIATIQKMVDTHPDLNSYSRVSYQRELHGDTAGAITAMRQAVEAGGSSSEATLWTQTQLGNLYFNSGELAGAEQAYQQALIMREDYVYALAGMARVRAMQGQSDAAIHVYQEVVKRLPLPEFVIALGELYEVAGKPTEAKRQYDLVQAIQQLNASAGIDVDMELALFDADHGADPQAAVQRARASYSRRPSIYGADALAWSLYRAGEHVEARRYATEALRLGTRDALLHYHAGMIAHAQGDRAAAREYLTQALAINPYFSVRHAPIAHATLAELGKPGL